MAVTRFEGSGPVARYWLANCEGFAVKGAARGVVDELIRDAEPFVTTRLVIRTRARRRKIISAAAVSSVVPEERLLIVSRRHREVNRRPRSRLVVAGSVKFAAVVAPRARSAADRVASAGPPARSALLASGRWLAVAAGDAWSLSRPAATVLAHSVRILATETIATGRLLLRIARRDDARGRLQ